MKLGMVGLGKMGASMTARLLAGGHRLVVFDRNLDAVRMSAEKSALASESLSDLVSKLETPRVVWVMVPAGEATESVIEELSRFLEEGDVVVDGGNSNYKDSVRRAAGDPSLFAREDEVELSWKIVDPFIESFESGDGPPLELYELGSWGPKGAEELMARDGRGWLHGCGGH